MPCYFVLFFFHMQTFFPLNCILGFFFYFKERPVKIIPHALSFLEADFLGISVLKSECQLCGLKLTAEFLVSLFLLNHAEDSGRTKKLNYFTDQNFEIAENSACCSSSIFSSTLQIKNDKHLMHLAILITRCCEDPEGLAL